MTRRLIMAFSLLTVTALSALGAHAAGIAKPKPTAVPYVGGLYQTKGLVPGHHYRMIVTSRGHVAFTGNGIENYTWVKNHQFGGSSSAIHFRGTTPKSFSIDQPVTAKLNGWIIALTLSNLRNQPMKVRFMDLGTKK